MGDKCSQSKENYEKINENYNKGSWGQNGVITEERGVSNCKNKKD